MVLVPGAAEGHLQSVRLDHHFLRAAHRASAASSACSRRRSCRANSSSRWTCATACLTSAHPIRSPISARSALVIDAVTALAKAESDDRVKGAFIRIGGGGVSSAEASELRAAHQGLPRQGQVRRRARAGVLLDRHGRLFPRHRRRRDLAPAGQRNEHGRRLVDRDLPAAACSTRSKPSLNSRSVTNTRTRRTCSRRRTSRSRTAKRTSA